MTNRRIRTQNACTLGETGCNGARSANDWGVVKRLLLGVLLGALSAPAVAGCSSTRPSQVAPSSSATTAVTTDAAPTFTMNGAFDVFVRPTSTSLASGAACKGAGTSSDISDATAVSVFDPQGKLIGTGGLSGGVYQSTPIGSACVFTITVDDVPDGLPTYSVEIGQRGEKILSSQQAHGQVFHVRRPLVS